MKLNPLAWDCHKTRIGVKEKDSTVPKLIKKQNGQDKLF